MKGSGILPVSFNERTNELVFLFGFDDVDDGESGWCDFGGARESNEQLEETACREAEEESAGFLGDMEELKRMITNNQLVSVATPLYTSFLCYIEYDDMLTRYFSQNYNCVQTYSPELIGYKGLFEKSKVKWFTFDDIQENSKRFRYFYYREIIPEIVKNSSILERMVKARVGKIGQAKLKQE